MLRGDRQRAPLRALVRNSRPAGDAWASDFIVFHVSGGTVQTPTGWRRDARSVARRSGSRRADLGDLAAVERAFAGAEVVVHMGAVPDPSAPFEAILNSNVVGGYHALEACRRQRVRRIVYASTGMTDWGYQFDEPCKAIREARFDAVPASYRRVTHRDAVRPTEPYSASKVWGEGLCRASADGHGLSCLCLRIGGVNGDERPRAAAGSALWCSQRDIATAAELAVNAPPELRFDIFFAVSDNRYRWLDIEHTRTVLGFQPADRAEDRL